MHCTDVELTRFGGHTTFIFGVVPEEGLSLMGRPSKYPAEFREQAVELVRVSGKPVAVIAAIVVNVAFIGAVDEAIDETTKTNVETPSDSSDGGAGSEDKAAVDDEVGTTRDNPAPLGSKISDGDCDWAPLGGPAVVRVLVGCWSTAA